ANQVVAKLGAGDVLDAVERIARGIAVHTEVVPEVALDVFRGAAVVHGVDAIAAVEAVGAGAAKEVIIAIRPARLASDAAAYHHVVEIGAEQICDEFKRVALRGAAKALTRGQIDPDADAGVAVGRRVDVAAEDASAQGVRAEAADEEVIALAALE